MSLPPSDPGLCLPGGTYPTFPKIPMEGMQQGTQEVLKGLFIAGGGG